MIAVIPLNNLVLKTRGFHHPREGQCGSTRRAPFYGTGARPQDPPEGAQAVKMKLPTSYCEPDKRILDSRLRGNDTRVFPSFPRSMSSQAVGGEREPRS
jgi:hypothetical protein